MSPSTRINSRHWANLAGLCGLFVMYYAFSYFFSPSLATRPGSIYILLCIGFSHALNLALIALAVRSFTKSQLTIVLALAASVCAVAIGAIQGFYLLARSRSWTEDFIPISYQQIKELALGSHLLFLVLLVALIYSSGRGASRLSKPSWHDYGLLLLCLIPLVAYHSANLEYFNLETSAEYFAAFFLVPAGVLSAAKIAEGVFDVSFNTSPIIAAMAWMFYSRAGISSVLRQPIESSIFPMLLILLGAALIVSLANLQLRRWLPVVAFLLVTLTALNGYFFAAEPIGHRAIQKMVDRYEVPEYLSGDFEATPDILFLIYDGYATRDIMERHGIDNGTQMNFLKERDFTLYDGIYTVEPTSLESMGRVLDMRYHHQNPIGGNNTVNVTLRSQGYRSHLVLSAYFLMDVEHVTADFSFPEKEVRDGLKAVYAGLLAGEFKSEFVFTDYERDDWLMKKRDILSTHTSYPKFLYAHSRYPGHSQNSGICLENESELYHQRLEIANEEMRRDIDEILKTQRESIIIVAGDHGPYLDGDCFYLESKAPSEVSRDELAERYGVFLAIHWPSGLRANDKQIEMLQDVFFAVFSTLTDDPDIWSHRLERRTLGFGPTIPSGGIKDGVIQFGKDIGQPLFGTSGE